MELENHTIGPLKELLQCLPKLQSLHFSEVEILCHYGLIYKFFSSHMNYFLFFIFLSFQGFAPCMRLCEDDWNLGSVPSCFLSSLKTVTYTNFHGNDTEISFLRNLVNNAIVLEKLNIVCSKIRFGDPKKQKEVKVQLQSLQRGSVSCAIKFM